MNNNNNEHNIKIYNLVFNNIYIRKLIFDHLNKFNILSIDICFRNLNEFQQFKYKQYLKSIKLEFNYDLNQLPDNITKVSILKPENPLTTISVPNHVEIIELGTLHFSFLNSPFLNSAAATSKLHSLGLILKAGKEIKLNSLPSTITSLTINSSTILNSELPNNLKNIVFNNLKTLQDIPLPDTITEASIFRKLKTVNQFSISSNLVKLKLQTSKSIKSNISFPNSIQELSISCLEFNAKLPERLKTLMLILTKYENFISFPSSLEFLLVYSQKNIQKEIFQNAESVPINLKELYFPCSRLISENGEPLFQHTKLDTLLIYDGLVFDQIVKTNHLPSSLTSLSFPINFNQVIDINVLPSNLERLSFDNGYSLPINPLAIPRQLKSLTINNRDYSHPINLTPSTHPYTLVSCHNTNLYYNPSYNEIRVLGLPIDYKLPLSTLQLQDKSNLEYLHLGYFFNLPIELSDLPIQNNIKTLQLSHCFKQTINLEHFQNLETIIIPTSSSPKIITTIIIIESNNSNNNNKIVFNNYSLKNIITSPDNTQFIKDLDINFYQFLKLK